MSNFYGYFLIDIKNEPLALDCNDISDIHPNEDMTYIVMKDGTIHLVAIETECLGPVWNNYQNSTSKPVESRLLKLGGPRIKLINKNTGKHELVYFTDIQSAGCENHNEEDGALYLYERTIIKLFNGAEYYIDIHAHWVIQVWQHLTNPRVYAGISIIDPFSKPLKIIHHNDLETMAYSDFIEFAKEISDDEGPACRYRILMSDEDMINVY